MSDAAGRPRGRLVLVATPIGNLGDLSARARQVLEEADLICCEDTRRTRALLSAMGIPAGGSHGDRLLSLHGHNEGARVDRVQACVAAGGTVAVVSDAGTPGISDPGTLLVSRLSEAGEDVSIVPGPTSVVAALVISGLPTDRFCVEGFLPRKGTERRDRVAVAHGRRTHDRASRGPRTGGRHVGRPGCGRCGAAGRGRARADQGARRGLAGYRRRCGRRLRGAPGARRGRARGRRGASGRPGQRPGHRRRGAAAAASRPGGGPSADRPRRGGGAGRAAPQGLRSRPPSPERRGGRPRRREIGRAAPPVRYRRCRPTT